MSGEGGRPGLLGPSSLASTETHTPASSSSVCETHPGTCWGGGTQKEGQSEDEEMAACSTAPLPRMQCDMRHREMAAKVQGKNIQLFMARASVVRSETET